MWRRLVRIESRAVSRLAMAAQALTAVSMRQESTPRVGVVVSGSATERILEDPGATCTRTEETVPFSSFTPPCSVASASHWSSS